MATLDYVVKAITFLACVYLVKVIIYSIFHAYHGPLSKIPGPSVNRFTQLPLAISGLRGESYRKALDAHTRYGDVIRLGPNVVSARDPDSIRKIIQEWDLPKAPLYERFKVDDNINTLFTERDKVLYRHKRRLLSPGFSISYLNAQEPLIHECSNVLREVLNEACQKAPDGRAVVDMYCLLAELAIDIITAAAFGGSLNLVRNKDHPLRSRTTAFFKKQNLYGIFGFLKLIPGSTKRRRDPQLYAMLDEILERRSATEKKSQKKDLLQIFLDAHEEDPKGYTFDHVKADMLLFLIAGAETTSSTITFALLLLVHNDQARKTLMKELDEAYPSKDDAITTDTAKSLPYLQAVIYETLRLMPPSVNGMPRITDRTVVLHNYVIPPETIIAANIYSLQHDPKVWGSDVEVFRPERWLESGGDELLKSAMYPFSAGSRNCIGKNFAMMELQLILATIARHYDMSLVPDQNLDLSSTFVLTLKAGRYDVCIQRRD